MVSPAEPTIPLVFPPFFTAGTTFKLDRQFRDYPAADWTYTLYLAGYSVLNQAATADADGITQHIVIAASATAALLPGSYRYIGRLSATDGEVFDIEEGQIVVQADIATQVAGDAVTHAEKTLAVIEAAIGGRLTKDIEHYSIAGRSVSKIPISELVKLRGTYAALVWKQNNSGSLMTPIKVVFPEQGYSPFFRRFGGGC